MSTRNIVFSGIALAAAVTLGGCGKSSAATSTSVTTPSTAAPAPEPTPAPSAVEPPPKPVQHVELDLASVGNTMTYDKKTLTVPTGAEVHLTLKNNSTVETLPHNWVLVKTGTEAAVAAAGLKIGDKAGYIDTFDHDMIVHTPLAKPGQSTEVTFTAPDPGTYPYICTVPGHYMMMKGVLTVTP
jgi:azurin